MVGFPKSSHTPVFINNIPTGNSLFLNQVSYKSQITFGTLIVELNMKRDVAHTVLYTSKQVAWL